MDVTNPPNTLPMTNIIRFVDDKMQTFKYRVQAGAEKVSMEGNFKTASHLIKLMPGVFLASLLTR